MKTMIVALLLGPLAAPAMAQLCESLALVAQEALDGAEVDADTRTAVASMIEEGRRLHDQGKHDVAEETLRTAVMMLGLM